MKLLLLTIGTCILSMSNLTYGQTQLPIDVNLSNIKWFGEYTFYFGGHDGTIRFEEGHFIKTGDVITGGEFVIDMNSIVCLDIENEEATSGLVDHLKDPDFFDVINYPKAKLSITRVEYHDPVNMKVYADLTVKGITEPIDFQAKVDFEKEEMITKFKIDRMRWDISYNSSMRDSAISDAIGFDIVLKLAKPSEK